jgi:hypothetical protein
MKNFVVGAIVGALVGALIGYLVWGGQVSDLLSRVTALETKLATAQAPPTTPPKLSSACSAGGNPHAAVIEITDDAAKPGFCKAKVYPGCVGNKRNMNVFWTVVYDSQTCAPSDTKTWQVKLVFADDTSVTPVIPYNGPQNFMIRPNVSPTKFKIGPNDNRGTFPFVVWFAPNLGIGYAMADPELQIEM